MATIHKMPTGKWRAQVRRAGHRPLSKVCKAKAEAERWARDVERKIDLGQTVEPGLRLKLTDVLSAYRAGMHRMGRSKDAALRAIEKSLGRYRLAELKSSTFIEYADARALQGAGPATIGMDLCFLAAAISHGGTLCAADETAARALITLKSARRTLQHGGKVARPQERSRRPNDRELERLITYWTLNPRQTIPMGDIVLWSVATAMRLSETTALLWSDIDLDARLVTIRDRKHPTRKRGNHHTVPLLKGPVLIGGRIVDPVNVLLRQRGTEVRSERAFPFASASISTAFTRAAAACGIKDLRFHDLRHDACSRFFEAGLQVQEVALISGHRDWGQLKRYTNLRPEDLRVVTSIGSRRWMRALTLFDRLRAQGSGFEDALTEVAAELDIGAENLRKSIRRRNQVSRNRTRPLNADFSAGIDIKYSENDLF
jgi:integrase